MPVLTWMEAYSVKVRSIDEQHKRLVCLINDLHDGMKGGTGKQAVGRTLTSLIDYTTTHFGAEEALMRAFGYSEYEKHKALHDGFVGQIVDAHRRYAAGDPSLSKDVGELLMDWLINHIQIVDRAYSDFFVERGVK